VPKIISERCELVKLCDINCSGPFFRHTVEFPEAVHEFRSILFISLWFVKSWMNNH